MPNITEQELKQQLGSGELARLYILAGEEKYLVKRSAKRLIKRAAGEVFPEFNNNEMGNGATIDQIADAAEALPFMAERKCVSIADWNIEEKEDEELNKVYELLDNLPESTTVIFWYPTLEWEGKKSAKWKKFLKAAEKQGNVLMHGRRDAMDLRKMLTREAEKAGCVLSRDGANRILEYAGNDVNQLLKEIEKLCAYALGSKGENAAGVITNEMIEALVAKTTETTAFIMARALVSGDYEKAYHLMDTLFYQNEEPIAIVGALASSYVDMYRVRAALESGLAATAPAEYADYGKKEFRLTNAQRNSKGVPTPVLRESLYILTEADMALKGSSLNKRVIMDRLIAKLLMAAQPGKA